MAYTVAEIIEWTKGRLVNAQELGDKVGQIKVTRPSTLEAAIVTNVAFFFSRDYEHELPKARAGVLVTAEPFVEPLRAAKLPWWGQTAVISCADPYLAMAIVSQKFASECSSAAHLEPVMDGTVHPTAVVHDLAHVSAHAKVGAHCVIERGAWVGSGTVLYPGCYVGENAAIGESCVIFPNVTIYESTVIGDRVRIHAGTVIGADGFGYAPIKSGKEVVGHQKIYHIGRVVIGNDVEIGASCSIDRGTFGDTVIGNNAKIDNQVQIAHNCHVGEGTVLCGCTGLAGSSSTGKYVYIGGMTGIGNKVHVGDGANVGALTLCSRDVPAGGLFAGNPMREYHEHYRLHAMLNKMMSERRKRAKT